MTPDHKCPTCSSLESRVERVEQRVSDLDRRIAALQPTSAGHVDEGAEGRNDELDRTVIIYGDSDHVIPSNWMQR